MSFLDDVHRQKFIYLSRDSATSQFVKFAHQRLGATHNLSESIIKLDSIARNDIQNITIVRYYFPENNIMLECARSGSHLGYDFCFLFFGVFVEFLTCLPLVESMRSFPFRALTVF